MTENPHNVKDVFSLMIFHGGFEMAERFEGNPFNVGIFEFIYHAFPVLSEVIGKMNQ